MIPTVITCNTKDCYSMKSKEKLLIADKCTKEAICLFSFLVSFFHLCGAFTQKGQRKTCFQKVIMKLK